MLGDHAANGLVEVGVREIKAQTRILRSQLEQRLGNLIDEKDPLMSWIPCHAANCVSRYRIMDDGRTPDQRRCGKTWKRPVVEFGESVHFRPVGENIALRGGDRRMLRGVYVGHHERSGAAIIFSPGGVKRERELRECLSTRDGIACSVATCIGIPWQLRPDQRNLARPVVPEAEADQGVAPVIVMPTTPRTDQRRYVTKRDLVKYGFTDECQACTQLASGMHNAKVPHDDRCRGRIGELTAEDDDQRQVERVSGAAEVEIPRPEAREEVDVGEPTVRVVGPVEDQPFPTVRVGGSSSSGTRAGSGSRANEANTDDRETKRVRFTESRGLKRQGEDVEEMVAKADEQHLDADVEVGRYHKTWRIEDVVGDAADAAPEQMNSFVQSKTEVFEKIEESLRPLCMVEDLNDEEIMELCILSNELNACETTAILNPSKFASCARRLGLREGFAVDFLFRANGTMWDLSVEDDRAGLRRVQKHFVHEHLKDSTSWEMPEVQSLVSDKRV